jgi:hypothetical protein
MLADQVIRLWSIVYDGDADQVYTFTDWASVMRSIEGSVESYLGDPYATNPIIKAALADVSGWHDHPFIPIKINDLNINVYMWELDAFNPLHKVIVKCYEQVNEKTKEELLTFFSNPL